MRIAQPISFVGLIALQIVLVSGCTTPVGPIVTRAPTTSLRAHPAVYVQTSAQRPRILDSLHGAGIRTTESFKEADYILTVVLGTRRVKMQCGGLHNVVYSLGDKKFQFLEIKGRGLTEECTPNVFDEMSQTLATYFGD